MNGISGGSGARDICPVSVVVLNVVNKKPAHDSIVVAGGCDFKLYRSFYIPGGPDTTIKSTEIARIENRVGSRVDHFDSFGPRRRIPVHQIKRHGMQFAVRHR